MENWLEPIRLLAALGFTGLLVMLRLEADRFGAAEYAEIDRYGGRAPLRRRLSWYLIGLGLVIATWFTIPDPGSQLYLTLGDRQDRRHRRADLRRDRDRPGGGLRLPSLPAPAPAGGRLVSGSPAQLGRDGVHRRGRRSAAASSAS